MADVPSQDADLPSDQPRYQPLVIVLAAVAAGIVVDRVMHVPVGVWWSLAAAGWAAWLVLWRRRFDAAAGLVLLLAPAAAGGAWHHLCWSMFGRDELGCFARRAAQPVCLEATACGGPRRVPAPPPDPMRAIPTGDRTRLEVDVTAIRDGAAWRPASGRTAVWIEGHLLGVHAGDRLRIFADLSSTRPPANPGEFDFAAYARADRILTQLAVPYPDCVSVVEPGGGWGVRRLIEELRTRGDRLLWQHLRHERSGLAAALLLGVREELSPERTEAFVQTGTIHMLAISGLHVGILVLAMSWALRLAMVPQRRAIVVIAALTVLYTLVTDAEPPVVRAMVLVLVTSGAYVLGRGTLGFNSLAAAGLVVLALNPGDLFRVGTQLSFLAVAGMAWFVPQWIGATRHQDPLERLIDRSRGWGSRALRWFGREAWQLVLVGTVVWLLALPLVMARFNLVSPVALVLNVLAWIPMLGAMISGFALLVFGWLIPPLAMVFGFCCDVSLWALEWGVRAGRDLPWSHFWVPGPQEWWLWGFYGALGAMAAFPRLRPPRRWCLALLAGWTAIGFGAGWAAEGGLGGKDSRLECTFLSVGHGSAVVLHLPDGRTMLYDAGRMGGPVPAARSIAGYLWSRGITHLDAVVLSHADADHYNALPELLRRISIGVVYVSPVMFEEEAESPALSALRAAIQIGGVPIREIHALDRLAAGEDCRIEAIHPPKRGVLGADNANSVVLAVEFRGRRVLLTGDLEPPGLDDVLAEPSWDCDVLLVPHHGSTKSNPSGLAAWCQPEWVVLSGGRQFDSRAAEAAYQDRGSRVLHTGRQGAIGVRIESDRLEVDLLVGQSDAGRGYESPGPDAKEAPARPLPGQ
jgi:competence protein ComEC